MDKMSEQSIYTKIKNALKLAKAAEVCCTFDRFEAIELLGYIQALEETVGLQRAEFDAQASRIAELEKEVHDVSVYLNKNHAPVVDWNLKPGYAAVELLKKFYSEKVELEAENAALKEAHKKTGDDVMYIISAALSGDYPRYLHHDKHDNRYCKWGVVEKDIRALFA